MIKYYSLKDENEIASYQGFILVFYLYTLFWPILFCFLTNFKIRYIKIKNITLIKNINSIYLILSMPYLFFGFGPYSNRFAVISWMFIQSLLIYQINITRRSLEIISFSLLFLSLFWFLFYRLNLLNVLT